MPTRIGKDLYDVPPVAPLDSFSLFPLWAPALGQAIRQLGNAAQNSGLLNDLVDINQLTLSDLKSLLGKKDAAFDAKIKSALLRHGPDLALALGQTIGMIKPGDLRFLTQSLLAGATKNGVPLYPVAGEDTALNREMKGKPIVLMQLFLYALQVNYADFSEAPADASAPGAAGASPSPTSIGTTPSGPAGV